MICRTVDQYLLQIRYEFRLQNIPLFCDEPTTPENTAPARAIHAALDLLRGGLTTTALLRLLKTGLVDLDRDSQCALENYAYTWPLHAQDWREPFTRNPEGYTDRMSEQSQQDLQRAEEARSFLVPRVQKFMDRARNADTATLTAQIYYFLQSLGAEEALQKLTDALRACGDLPNADEALREWNVITELLDQMVHLLPAGEPITPADYDDLFTLLLRTTDMGHIPQSMDSVIFTTAGRMRLPETEAVFVMGLAEGEFPQTPGDTGLLSHADRDTMIALGAELPDCFENRVIREQVCFYKALTVAQKYLWLSWPGGAAGLPGTAALAPALELLRVPPAVVQPEEPPPLHLTCWGMSGSRTPRSGHRCRRHWQPWRAARRPHPAMPPCSAPPSASPPAWRMSRHWKVFLAPVCASAPRGLNGTSAVRLPILCSMCWGRARARKPNWPPISAVR